MEDWAGESPSDDDDVKEIENELYSMFYYHTDGIPDDLANKYDLDSNDFGVTISLKDDADTQEKIASQTMKNEHGFTVNERYIDGSKGSKGSLIQHNELQSLEGIVISNSVKPLDDLLEKRRNETANKLHERDTTVSKIASSLYLSEKVNRKRSNSRNILSNKLKLPHLSSEFVKNSKFNKSFRYFVEGDSVVNKSNAFNKAKSSNQNQVEESKKDSQVLEFSTSTPILNKRTKMLPNPKYSACKLILNVSKNNNSVIDLTKEPNKAKQRGKKKFQNEETQVITLSSDSEDSDSSEITVSDSAGESDNERLTSDSTDFESEEFDSILLNTSTPVDPNVCDISGINTDYNWRLTSSPEGWTKSMKKFYNKPSKELLTFDVTDYLQEIRKKPGSSCWDINNRDLHNRKGQRQTRCLRCQTWGHLKANCTKVFSCHMCGTPGHSSKSCPQKMCLKCGSKSRAGFLNGCGKCTNEEQNNCVLCGDQGHDSKFCTHSWRSFPSENTKNSRHKNKAGPKYCCNCGKRGHLYEECSKTHSHPSHSLGDLRSLIELKGNRPKKVNKKFDDSHARRPSANISQYIHFKINPKFSKAKKKRIRSAMNQHLLAMKTKNHFVSKRILMLRKSNKRKKFKSRLSATI